ncbi:MAG: TetR/AcrR family transcriptional regulator [Acidimicrobiales bacterium]
MGGSSGSGVLLSSVRRDRRRTPRIAKRVSTLRGWRAVSEPGGRGRPRRPETDAAIYAATRQVLRDVGYGELTIEEVAKRAGVGKPTVYRRHDSKASLVGAAMVGGLELANPELVQTNDVAADLRVLLTNLCRALTDDDFGSAVTELVSPAARDASLAEILQVAADERRILIRTLVQRAHDENRLRSGDIEASIDMALGAIYFRHLVAQKPLDRRYVRRLVDSVIDPVRAE